MDVRSNPCVGLCIIILSSFIVLRKKSVDICKNANFKDYFVLKVYNNLNFLYILAESDKIIS